jgi:hypothetical protein
VTIHIRRREFIITLGSMTVGWPGAARAQYPIVGVVSSRSLPDSAMSVAAFAEVWPTAVMSMAGI